MNYFVKRDLSEYGPYTLAELQRYVASGNVLLTDVCRSDGMSEWVPVSQVIGNIPVAPAAPAAATAPPVSMYPPPPSLHWGIAVVLGILTCGIFGWVWALVQSAWMRKVNPASKAVVYYGIAVGLLILTVIVSAGEARQQPRSGISSLFNLAAAIIWLVASFSMRTSIEEHFTTAEPVPMGMSLSGVMTFFFNVYYFQYHFTQINDMKKRLGA